LTVTQAGGALLDVSSMGIAQTWTPGTVILIGAVANPPAPTQALVILNNITNTNVTIAFNTQVYPAYAAANANVGPVNFNGAGEVNVYLDLLGPNQARRVVNFETEWVPPINVFKLRHALPSGNYTLRLVPRSVADFINNFVESQLTTRGTGNYTVTCVSSYLYLAVAEGPISSDHSYLLDLKSIFCNADVVPNAGWQQKNFTLPPSTETIIVAYQDARAGQDTRFSAGKFKSYGNTVAASQVLGADQAPLLNQFQISYAGMTFPNPQWDPMLGPGGSNGLATDYTTELYYRMLIETFALYDGCQAETLKRWRERGQIYVFRVARPGESRATQCSVYQSFATGTEVQNMRVMVFAIYRQTARVKVMDSLIRDVVIEEA